MDQSTLFILFVIAIAYLFDFINGFHDAANAIATIVTTGVLSPRQAVLWAAFFNFIAFIFFSLMVAKTIGSDLIDTPLIDSKLILSALIGAIFWGLLTWYFGMPTSSSQSLIGGLAGAAIMRGGLSGLKLSGFVKVGIGIILSPIIGLIAGFLCGLWFTHITRHHDEKYIDRLFKYLQLGSSALISLTHGSNDAQKTMGIIASLLFSVAWLQGPFYVPFWVVISCQAMISLGTLVGGWRIVTTMGQKITQLNTLRGCAAETGAALTVCLATEYGIPVSTTQTVTGAIAGVGLIRGLAGTYWSIFRKILWTWLCTMPATAVVAGSVILLLD